MLEFAPSAKRHVRSLIRYYRRRYRFEAEFRLLKTLEDASDAVQRGTTKFLDAPPQAPGVATYGLLWFKVWHYWIAISSQKDPQIVAVIYETANIAGQMAKARPKPRS